MAQYFARFDKSQVAVLQATGREIADFATEVGVILQRMPPAPPKFLGTDWQATNTNIRNRLQQAGNLLTDESNALFYAMSLMEAAESGRVSLSSIVSPTFTADIGKLSGSVIVNKAANIAQNVQELIKLIKQNIGDDISTDAAYSNWLEDIFESQAFRETMKTIKGAFELGKIIVGPSVKIGASIGMAFGPPGMIVGGIVGGAVGVTASIVISFLLNTEIGNTILDTVGDALSSAGNAAFNWAVLTTLRVGSAVTGAAQSAWNFTRNLVTSTTQRVTSVVRSVTNAVHNGVLTIKRNVAQAGQNVGNAALNVAQNVNAAIASGARGFWDFSRDRTTNVAQNITNIVTNPVDTLVPVGRTWWNSSRDRTTNVTIPVVQNIGTALVSGAQSKTNTILRVLSGW